MKNKKKYIVHFENNGKGVPRPHEKSAAKIVADHFKSDVVFLRTSASKTPDLYILKTNTRWELKSPIGGGKHTIQNNLRKANHQSQNIILDFRHFKHTTEKGVSRVNDFLKNEKHHTIEQLKVISKEGNIIDIK